MDIDKSIYVIVARKVTVGGIDFELSHGGMAAQACHVISRYWFASAKITDTYKDITTIILEARNSKEIIKVISDLHEVTHTVYTFHDCNEDLYLCKDRVLTAVCTTPVLYNQVESAIGHLELM